jgi:hypothetical protein
MTIDEMSLVINTAVCILSFILALISVITLIISLRQNGNLIRTNCEQLNEMRKERELAVQPILAFSNPKFIIEKPRLFYSPPDDEYSISSRFKFKTDVENISSAVAINVVCIGVGIMPDSDQTFSGKSASNRINVLGDKKESLDFMFIERKKGMVFNSLREENVKLLPRGKVEVVFKNTSGGAFRMVKQFLIYPHEEELDTIKMWHSIVSSAEVEHKEELRSLREEEEKDEALFSKLFDTVSKAGGDEKEVAIECIELEDSFI